MNKKPQGTYQYSIIFATFLISCFGLLAIASASSLKSQDLYSHPYHFVYKQLLGIIVGFFIIYIIMILPSFKLIERSTVPFLVLSFILLSLIYIPGFFQTVGGAKRWLNVKLF